MASSATRASGSSAAKQALAFAELAGGARFNAKAFKAVDRRERGGGRRGASARARGCGGADARGGGDGSGGGVGDA